jgi:hypothetical protein
MSEGKEMDRKKKKRLLQFERFKIRGEFQQFANSVTGLPEAHRRPHPPTAITTYSFSSSYPSVHYSQAIDSEKIKEKRKEKFLTNNWLREQMTAGRKQLLNTARLN